MALVLIVAVGAAVAPASIFDVL